MMMKLNPYPKYKDSGIQWIGEIPEEWENFRLKHVINEFIAGGTPSSDNDKFWAQSEDEGIPWVTIGDMTDEEIIKDTTKRITKEGLADKRLRILKKGTLIYSIFASLGKVSILGIDVTTNQAILGLINSEKIDNIFLKYYLRSLEEPIFILSNANTQNNLNSTIVKNVDISIPEDKKDQIAIASFLDKRTAKMDALIEKDKKLIALLKEKRTALINHAVTKGLDPNVKLKDSGVEWIGEIPEGWNIKKLKFVARIKTGDKNTEDHIPKGKYPFFVRSQTVERLNTYTFNGEAVLTAGDGVGVGKVFHYYNGKFDFHQRVYAITHFKEVLGKYAYYYLKNNLIKEMLKYNAKSTVDSLRLPMFLNFVMTFPKNIQQQIQNVKYLDKATSKIDNTINTIQEKIILMEEYKKSLIHHVVTGKVDVRGVEA